jgi:hypothetical protein
MGNKVLCTKCGQGFSKKGIRLHELHCVGAASTDDVHAEVLQRPKPEAASTDEVHDEVLQQPKTEAASTDEVHDEVHDEESSGSVSGAVAAFFAFLVGVVILGYFWLKRSKSQSGITKSPALTSPTPSVDLSTSLLGHT